MLKPALYNADRYLQYKQRFYYIIIIIIITIIIIIIIINSYNDYSATARTGALGRRLFNNDGFWKQKFFKFFCKGTNKIQG